MKVKELEKFAHSAWSPLSCNRTYLATVTAENDREATDSNINTSMTSPTLDIYEFNVKENNLSMQMNISLQIKQKATSLLWTTPINNDHLDIGLLIIGSMSGSLYLYDSQKLISMSQNRTSSQITTNTIHKPYHINTIDTIIENNENDNSIMSSCQQLSSIYITENNMSNYLYTSRENIHNNVVRSLDFNRFQTNLFASASNDEEIFIWDVGKMEHPMSPGSKIQPLENVNQVAWNPRVQHILCSTSIGRCVIWDLRKSGPVLQLTKTMCQLEPQMMAWSPDVATRLCIADPNNPNANVQLWDLRYPKHMLCLLSHWPPLLSSNLKTTNPLNNYALGNAGTVNSLCWGIPECQKSMNKSNFYDKDMIVMTIGASGALPTLNGNYGTKLNPTYAEMLVVWSVNQALNSTPDNVTCQEAIPEPIFIGRLEGLDDQELVNPLLCFNTLPTNASVQWIPNHPNLICVTQSDGWITVYNLLSGINKQIEQINIERYNKQCILARNSLNLRNSHKVAEVFHNEQLLMDYNNTDNTIIPSTMNNNNNDNLQSDSLYPVFMNDPNVNSIDKEQINSGSDQLLLDNPNSMDSVNLSLPQPMPLLRVAPSWLKRPCGVHFAFGGRLVTFSSLTNLQSKRTRTNSSMSSSKRTDPNSRSSDIGSIEQNSTVGTVPDQNHLNSTEVQSYYVFIKCIDAFQLEPSSSPTVQLHSSVNSDTNGSDDQWKNSIQDIIECLISVLDCPNDYLSTVCENAKALFKPMLSNNNNNPSLTNGQGHLDLWNVIQARLDKSTSVKSSLSNLLGYSKQDFQGFNESTPSQLLDALKYALVTNDIQTIIQLCLHPKFSSLSLPNLSTLSIFAIMLTDLHRSKQIELYEDVKLKLYQSLNEISLNNHIIHDPILNSIIMLFNCVLLRTNWLNIIENWPLSDWKTILTALINHLWDQDIELLRKLCSIFAKRLLDNTTNDNNNINISSFESGLAACICCIIGDDLDHLTECWLRLNNINENHLDDVIKCLPLALLLLFLFRLSSSTGINHCTNKSSQLLIHLAIWLIETRFDHNHNNGSNEQISLLALNLLTKTLSIVELYSQTMNNLIDLRHRIWCNLSMEQQQQQQQKQQILSNELSQHFLCPYPHIQCHCGLSKANSSTEIQSSLFIKTTNSNHYQPQQSVNYPSLSNQTMQCTYQSKINQNQFYEQNNFDSFNYPTFSSSSTNCSSFNDSVVGVQTSISGQNKSTFNFSPPISSHNADVLPSLTSPVPSTIVSSSSSSNIYSPLGLPPVNLINQSNLSSARQFPPVVAPPLLDANYNNNNNNRNYPVMNHRYVQPPNNNLLGTDSVSGNSMSNVLKPPLPATLASPTQSAQISTTFGHNFGGTMPPSFQSLNNVPYGMLTPIPQFNTQQQQEHIQQHMPPLLPAPTSIPPPPPPPTQTQHQSSVISPGWNDPPILTTDKPRQTTVSHNPYYNPMEFISSPLPQPNNSVSPSNFPQPMMELHTTPSNPPLPPGCPATGLNVYQPAPPPIQNSISPINAGIVHPQQQLQQPLPLSSTHIQQQSLSSSFMGPPVQQPSYPQVQGVYHQQEQYPNYFQPPIEQNSQFCTISSTLPPMSSVVPPNSYTELNLWPAAQPLSTTVKSGITSQTIIENAMPSNSFTSSNDDHTDLQLSHKLDSTSLNSDHNNVNGYSLPTEFQPIKKVLFDLIENCRKVGDKQTRHKLMNVEYCLNQFYNNISTGQLQLDQNSMEYLQFCISSIQSNDYVNALKQINLFIQSAIELSDIQYYGPALKRLIQTAKQLSINMNNINH